MFFAIQETPYDLKWRMFRIHVRVHPLFWLISAIWAWDVLHLWGIPAFLVVIACIFVSPAGRRGGGRAARSASSRAGAR